jgi:Fic family protein
VENQPGLAANQRGEYRDISNTIVRIGNYIAPLPEEVPSLMNVWIDRWSYLKPFAAHLAFERIHPFADGNGRVGRLLMWRQEIENGDDLTFIPFDRRHKYYDALQAASTLAIELGLEKYISL